jgi:hypothetical protein
MKPFTPARKRRRPAGARQSPQCPGKAGRSSQLEAEQIALEQKLHPGALAALRNAGRTFASHLMSDDTWDVNLDDQPITDLSSLQHEQISRLSLKRTNVSDLTPLRGLPLKSLAIGGSKVTDLGPLKGMPLESLQISGSGIADLNPRAECRCANCT